MLERTRSLAPLPPPAQRRPAEVGAAGSAPNLKELDARLFIDTLTDGLGLAPERQQVRNHVNMSR